MKKILNIFKARKKGLFCEPRELNPISSSFGYDRGQPIRRYYIEKFLKKYENDVCGSVLEIGDSTYTRMFGSGRVKIFNVLHVSPDNPSANIIGDLETGEGLPREAFDCMILTQTLSCIYDVKAAIKNSYLSLRPAGSLLVTVPGISQISRYDMDRWGEYWRFTEASIRKLFGEVFGEQNITVETYGNVLTAAASLYGLASHEITSFELDYRDADYQVLIAVRAVKNAKADLK